MPSVSCCSRRLACSERVSWSSKQVLPLRGELMVLVRGGTFVSGGVLHPYGVAGWLDPLSEWEVVGSAMVPFERAMATV